MLGREGVKFCSPGVEPGTRHVFRYLRSTSIEDYIPELHDVVLHRSISRIVFADMLFWLD